MANPGYGRQGNLIPIGQVTGRLRVQPGLESAPARSRGAVNVIAESHSAPHMLIQESENIALPFCDICVHKHVPIVRSLAGWWVDLKNM